MEKRIKELGQDTRLGIASGNVIPSVAAAVKELLENSLDAGATSVDIRLTDFGTECIEVADNGHGVGEQDYESLVLRSHTSKLHNFEDLSSVDSFGFRGEALSALCNLSESFRVHTKTASDKTGCNLTYDRQGALVSKAPLQKQPGTTVVVRKLFNHMPVRRETMVKQSRKEFAKILRLVHAYGIVSSGVRITCSNTSNNKTAVAVRTSGHRSMMDNIKDIYGSASGKLIPMKMCTPDEEILEEYNLNSGATSGSLDSELRLEGWISDPTGQTAGRGTNGGATNDRQFIFIGANGRKRPCENPKVAKLIMDVYREFSSKDTSPFYIMTIHLDRENIDVNVVPSKNQVLVHNEKLLLATVKATIRNTCATSAGAAPADTLKVQKNQLPPVIMAQKLALESAHTHQASFAGRERAVHDPETVAARVQAGLANAVDCRLFKHLQFKANEQPQQSPATTRSSRTKPASRPRAFSKEGMALGRSKRLTDNEDFDEKDLEGSYEPARNAPAGLQIAKHKLDTPHITSKHLFNDTRDTSITESNSEQPQLNTRLNKIEPLKIFSSQIEEPSQSQIPKKPRSIIFSQFSTQGATVAPSQPVIDESNPFGSQPFNSFGLNEPSQTPVDLPSSTQTTESDNFALDFVAAATRKNVPAEKQQPIFDDIDVGMERTKSGNDLREEVVFENTEASTSNNNAENSIRLPSVTTSNFPLNDSFSDIRYSETTKSGEKVDGGLILALSSVTMPKGAARTTASSSPFKVPQKRASEVSGPSTRTKQRTPKSSVTSKKDQPVYSETVHVSLTKIREALLKKQEQRRKNSPENAETPAFRADITPSQNEEAEKELQRNIQKGDFKDMQIIGQFNHGFIVTRLQDDFFLIDQHASDERYNYEDLQRSYTVNTQKMIR
ncbi:hypothetical protein RvY_08678-2 [Ramazzottius varieornatus]|nr:hypothetical protein RvY_08678-2 [Ramazzottius varieornatus]